MVDAYRPETESQLADMVAWAAAEKKTLDLLGTGTKAALGRPVEADARVSLGGFSGIVDYAPNELVLTAKAGTPLAEVRAALEAAGQMLAFEPIDHAAVLGTAEGGGTIGGLVACNLAGPRRIALGAARDHLLGCKGVGGTGVPFKAGGRVVKNVTGFDLSKLLCGSWGTLAALTEVTLKVLPRPEKSRTVLVLGLDDARAVQALSQALGSAHEVSGAAHLPEAVARASGVDLVAAAGRAVTAIRVEGPAPSVEYRCAALRNELASFGDTEELHSHRSAALWDEVRCLRPLAEPRDRLLWRLSVPPTDAPAVLERLGREVSGRHLLDWGGGLIWFAMDPQEDAAEEAVRGAIAHAAASGHATLVRAPEEIRRRVPVFPPQEDGLAALTRRVKQNLDPGGVFSPGRMVAGL